MSTAAPSSRQNPVAADAGDHSGAMPRSKWRLANPDGAQGAATSPDSHLPRSVSLPSSVKHGLENHSVKPCNLQTH